ncbi:hypothetical protein B0T09DRAFT_177710 [Sordaria sp. MPI-SDFR-AT-0083]|nr:hypothetical protein B0T09DRAFT_177710 [Sordaria sp. MPI-SDFR-AT-0083]
MQHTPNVSQSTPSLQPSAPQGMVGLMAMQASPPPMQPQSPRPAGSGTDAQQDTTHTLYNQAYTQQHQSPYGQVSPMSPGQTLQTATGPAPILGPQLASANLLGVTGTEAWQFQNMAAAYQTQSWHGQLTVNSTGQAQTQTLRDSRVDSYSTVETLLMQLILAAGIFCKRWEFAKGGPSAQIIQGFWPLESRRGAQKVDPPKRLYLR